MYQRQQLQCKYRINSDACYVDDSFVESMQHRAKTTDQWVSGVLLKLHQPHSRHCARLNVIIIMIGSAIVTNRHVDSIMRGADIVGSK